MFDHIVCSDESLLTCQVVANVLYNNTSDVAGYAVDAAVLFDVTIPPNGQEPMATVLPTAAGRQATSHC
eukprot:scaffold70759_cov21-Prasinocladus_malaysianus.AAC.1